MRISVVIPTKKYSKNLEECLKAINRQSKKAFEKAIVSYPEGDVENSAKKYGFRLLYDSLKTIGNAYYTGAKNSKGEITIY